MEKNVNVLPKGTELHNGKRKYKVEQVLGTGGFGITYKVSSTVMVDNVAINTFFAMKEYFLSSCYRDKDNATMLFSPTMKIEVEQSLNDFITEAKRLNSLGHKSDNIVKVNEVFKENGTAYYIMEYLEGGNLQEYVRKKGPLNEAEAIALITPIAHAVDTLHSERILHLDIKPENIVLKKDRDTGMITPVLIDFGLVKHFDSKGKPTTRLAAKGASDGFAPMEQYTTIDNFAPTLDVYALGATLYYLLKGKNPPKAFDIESSAALKDTLPASVTEKTKDAIAHAMEKSRFERTPTVKSFMSSFSICEDVTPKETPTKTTPFRNENTVRLGNKMIVFGVAIVIVICGISILSTNNNCTGQNIHVDEDSIAWIEDTMEATLFVDTMTVDTIEADTAVVDENYAKPGVSVNPPKINPKKGNDVQRIVDQKQKEKDHQLPIPQPKKEENGTTSEDLIKDMDDKYN